MSAARSRRTGRCAPARGGGESALRNAPVLADRRFCAGSSFAFAGCRVREKAEFGGGAGRPHSGGTERVHALPGTNFNGISRQLIGLRFTAARHSYRLAE